MYYSVNWKNNMIKYFCDCCGKESTQLNSLKLRKHISDMATGSVNGFTDRDGNRVSAVTNSYYLCNECYNRIALVSLKKFNELKTITQEGVRKG